MSIKSFRVLLMLHLLALVASVGVDFLPGAIPEALEQAYYELPQPVLMGQAVLLLMAIPLLMAWLAGVVGLLLMKRWGRGLSLYLTLFGLLIYPVTGPSLASGWSSGLSELAALSWGAALACAYFSPVAEAFATGGQRVAAQSPQGVSR
ncbi:MAG: hypothetical protein ACOVKS_09440 [Aquimonas sp.]|jgi:hypothetical protein